MKSAAAWALAFFVLLGSSGALITAMLRRPSKVPPPEPKPVVRREARTVSNVELELILNKIREGDLQAAKGDPSAARKAWGEAREMGEGIWPIHEGLGDSYARVAWREEALAEYLTAERFVPDNLPQIRAGLVFKRASFQALLDRPDDAFHGFLELDQPEAVLPKLVACFGKSRSKEALFQAVKERAAQRDPRIHAVAAVLAEKLGRKAEVARAWVRYVIACAPWDRGLTKKAVELLRAEKLFDDAVEVCRAWAKAEPQDLDAYRAMGDLYRESGREREAFVAYSSIVDVRAGDANAHRLFGQILVEMKRFDEAIAQYEAARKARPEDQATYTILASLYESKGDGAKSEELVLEAAKRFGMTDEFRSTMLARFQDQIAKARAAGRNDEVARLRERYVAMKMPETGLFDVKIVMTLGAPTHIDLDVAEPGGETVNHEHPDSKPGGRCPIHNTAGTGPVIYTLKSLVPGTYRIGAHHHEGVLTTARFVVILYEDTPRETRSEHTLVFEKAGEQKWLSDVVIK